MRRRNVTCSRNTGIDCDPQKMPLALSACFTQDCRQVMDNFGMDWSGSGWPSNEVLNEINSIPEVKSAPKHSTTRAQPRDPNDLNHVVEGDFHYHNNIEDIDRSPVQVDDFYYDYNFINFHEDLSDDVESDGDGSEDRHAAPQEPQPTSRVKEEANVETTWQPESTTIKDDGNATAKESVQTVPENAEDFLSEDYLLPVHTTHSPPLSTTQRSQTPQHTHDSRPEDISLMPNLEFSTEETTQDLEYGEEAEKNHDGVAEEENIPESVAVTPKHATSTAGDQTTANTAVFAETAQQTEEPDEYEFSSRERSTLGSEISARQKDADGPKPTTEAMSHNESQGWLDESGSEKPQTTSPSTTSLSAFTSSESYSHQTDFDTLYATSQYSWDSDTALSTTLLTATEKPTALPTPSPATNSGNRETSDDSTSLTGEEITPPTTLKASVQPPPADFPPATVKPNPTEPASTQSTGADSTSRASSFPSADFGDNQKEFPETETTGSEGKPSPSYQLTESTAPQQSTPPVPRMELPTPVAPILPSHPPFLWPMSVESSAATLGPTAAHWVTGNWSAVSPHSPPTLVFQSPSTTNCVSAFMSVLLCRPFVLSLRHLCVHSSLRSLLMC